MPLKKKSHRKSRKRPRKGTWLLARVKSNQYQLAQHNIAQQGYQFYNPKYCDELGKLHPLFPPYIFVLTDGSWYFLKSTIGIQSVVMTGDKPKLVPHEVIDELKSNENKEGFVTLSKFPIFNEGDRVLVTKGQFRGLEAIYLGMPSRNRVEVLFEILGKPVAVPLKRGLIEPANQSIRHDPMK